MKTTVIARVLFLGSCALGPGCASHPCPTRVPSTPLAERRLQQVSRLGLGWPIWIGIVCDDLQAQRRFYRDVLGLEERSVQVDSSWFVFGDALLELLAKSELPQYARRGVAVGFAVSDVRAARAELVRRGVEPVGDVDGSANDGHWAYFKDAEGNLFELVELRTQK